MRNFWTLVKFEYKKILIRKSAVFAILIGIASLLFTVSSVIIPFENNSELSNYELKIKDRENAKKFSGQPLEAPLIIEARDAYRTVDMTDDNVRLTEIDEYQYYARNYMSIKKMFYLSTKEFQNLSDDYVYDYYGNRNRDIRNLLTNNYINTESDVDYLMSFDEKVEKPFILQYVEGYKAFFIQSQTTTLLLLFLICFIISPIFSDEYNKNIDGLILSSKNGKSSFVLAKIFTSVTISVALSMLFIVGSLLCNLLIYGFGGSSSPIQLIHSITTLDFTILEMVFTLIIMSAISSIFMSAICTTISSLVNKSIIPMTICNILIFMSLFNTLPSVFYNKLRFFMPPNMGNAFRIFEPFVLDVFGMQILSFVAVSIVAVVLSFVLYMVSYNSFRNHQIS